MNKDELLKAIQEIAEQDYKAISQYREPVIYLHYKDIERLKKSGIIK